MASTTDSDEPTLPVIEGTPVAARHIVAADADTLGAVEVLPGFFWAPAAQDGLTGEAGWVSASVERRVRDTSQLQGFVLPNAPGADGVEHRDRFAVRTDPTNRLGDEWIEMTDETTGEPLAVVTTETARVDRTSVNVAGPDGAALLSGLREGKVAPWTPHAPIDVVDWYSQTQQVTLSHDFAKIGTAGWTPTTSSAASVTSSSAGTRILSPAIVGGASQFAQLRLPFRPNQRQRAWTVKLNMSVSAIDPNGAIQFGSEIAGGGYRWRITSAGPRVNVFVGTGFVAGSITPLKAGDLLEFTIVAIDGWLVFLVNGITVGQIRRQPAPTPELDSFFLATGGGAGPTDVTVQNLEVVELRPFLRRAAPTPDRRVVGVPTPGGLRGDYFLTGDEWVQARGNLALYGAQVPAPLAQAYAQRLDAGVSFSGSSWAPPGPPSGQTFAVRWSGSIYLGLGNEDIALRLREVQDMARVWVGSARADGAYLDAWGGGGSDTVWPSRTLRAHLGQSDNGWYPIVIEYAKSVGTAVSLRLEAQYSTDSSQSWYVCGPERLSPYGCWEGELGGESHRSAIDSVCNTTGLNWRLQPKTLESGEFPGRLEVGARLGRDTDYVLGEAEATEYASEVRSADVVDRVVADAQGLGDNVGREGLTASITDPSAPGRPWVLTRAETLSDITEQVLLRQRLSTILALYGSAAEEISARPRGKRTLTDSFPTTGAARVFLWEPDDAIRVRLPTIGVDDRTPRGLTAITWPLTPAGRGAPTVGFRQRPRHLRETLKRLQRNVATQRRRYQGQLSHVTGSLGSTSTTVAADGYSRISLPIGNVAKVEVYVMSVSGTPTLEVCGVSTGLTITQPGPIDVTAFVPPGSMSAYARLVGSLTYGELQMVATVRL